jgi:hypothetical protein
MSTARFDWLDEMVDTPYLDGSNWFRNNDTSLFLVPRVFVFDAVYTCVDSTLHIIARPYAGEVMDFELTRASLFADAGAVVERTPLNWTIRTGYEVAAVGTWVGSLPAEICGDSEPSATRVISLALHYGPSARWNFKQILRVIPPPLPPADWRAVARQRRRRPAADSHAYTLAPAARTPLAMCTTVTRAGPLLATWVQYWALMGVESFYIYVTRQIPGERIDVSGVTRALRIVSSGRAIITVIPWDYPMFAPSSRYDHNYAQPTAINSCVSRYGNAHDTMFFYDVDEFLVLPRAEKRGLVDYIAARQRLMPDAMTLVTRMAWALVGTTPSAVNASREEHRVLRIQPRLPPNATLAALSKDAALACEQWEDGPHADHLHDDDSIDLGLWDVNGTRLEHACWAAAGEASPSARPSPEQAAALEDDDYTPVALDDVRELAKFGLFIPRRSPRYSAPPRPTPQRLGVAPSDFRLEDLATLPISRSAVLGSGREKYAILNMSAFRALRPRHLVNIHGVYSMPPAAEIRETPDRAYHLHFLNADAAGSQALRVATFLFNEKVKEPSGPGVNPGSPPGEALTLFNETELQEGIQSQARRRARKM